VAIAPLMAFPLSLIIKAHYTVRHGLHTVKGSFHDRRG
jgi:hypothetical protein